MRISFTTGMWAAVATAMFYAAPPVSAQASQIVLSCTTPAPESKSTKGCASSELAPGGTPGIINGGTLYFVAGFWVWCQSPTGGTPYGPDCNGAMYIGEVNLATGKAVYQATSISGSSSPTGITGLEVTFKSSDGDMSCTLAVPTSPSSGGGNILSGACNAVPIVFSNAVVQVTQ